MAVNPTPGDIDEQFLCEMQPDYTIDELHDFIERMGMMNPPPALEFKARKAALERLRINRNEIV